MAVNLKADTTGKYGEYGFLPALYDIEAAFNSASGSKKKDTIFSLTPIQLQLMAIALILFTLKIIFNL